LVARRPRAAGDGQIAGRHVIRLCVMARLRLDAHIDGLL
jgi:hypothetical protein